MGGKIIVFLASLPSYPWFSYLWPIGVSIITILLSNKFYSFFHESEHRYNLKNSLPQLLIAIPSVVFNRVDLSRCFFAELIVPVQKDRETHQNAYYNFSEWASSQHCDDANLIAVHINNDSEKGISFMAFTDPKHGNISLGAFLNRCLERKQEIVFIFLSKDLPSKILFECDGIPFYYALDMEKTSQGSYVSAIQYT